MAITDYLTVEEVKKIKKAPTIDTSNLKSSKVSALPKVSVLPEIKVERANIEDYLPKTDTSYRSNVISNKVQDSLLEMPEMTDYNSFTGHNYSQGNKFTDKVTNALKRVDNAGTGILQSIPAQLQVIEEGVKPNDVTPIKKQMEMQKNALDRMNYLSTYKHKGNTEALQKDKEYQEALKLYNSASRVVNAYDNKPMKADTEAMNNYARVQGLKSKATEGLSPTAQYVGNIAIDLGETIATLPTALINPAMPLAMAGARTLADEIYETAQKGGSQSEALLKGSTKAGLTALTEKIGLDRILGTLGSPAQKGIKSLATNIIKQGGTEGLEEGAEYIGGYAIDKMFDRDTQFSPQELGMNVLGGAIGGGVMGGLASGVSGLRNNAPITSASDTPITPVLDMGRIPYENEYRRAEEPTALTPQRTIPTTPLMLPKNPDFYGDSEGNVRSASNPYINERNDTIPKTDINTITVEYEDDDYAIGDVITDEDIKLAIEIQEIADKKGMSPTEYIAESNKPYKDWLDSNYQKALKDTTEYMLAYEPKGTTTYQYTRSKGESGISEGYARVSNNEEWYRELYKRVGHKPNKSQIRQYAEEVVRQDFERGTRIYMPDFSRFVALVKQYEKVGDEIFNGAKGRFIGANKMDNGYQLMFSEDYVGIPELQPNTSYPIYNARQLYGRPEAVSSAASTSSAIPGTLPTASFGQNTVGSAQNNPNSTRQRLDDLAEQYGALPQGENATRIANLPRQIDDSNMRTGKFAGTIIESGNISDDLVEAMESDIANGGYRYRVISDAESKQRASKIISKDEGKTALAQWDNAVRKGAFDKYDIALGEMLLAEISGKDVETASKIAGELTHALTVSGQVVQAGRLLKRLTPEGMVAFAELELAKIRRDLALDKQSQKKMDSVKLTNKDTSDIKLIMEEVSTMPDGRDKDVKLAQVKAIIESKIPSNAGDKVRALARVFMLFNPKTMIRNPLGNIAVIPQALTSDVIGTAIDKAVSSKTGKRTTSLPQLSSVSGIVKGVKEATEDYRLGINTRDIEGNRFELTTNTAFKGDNVLSKAIKEAEKATSYPIDLGDRPFYEMWYDNSLKQQMKANKVSEPTDAMREVARQEALKRTWQDNNTYTRSVADVRRILNRANIKGYGLGDMIMPFVKTPANLTKALIDYSPIGVLNAINSKSRALNRAISTGEGVELAQREFVDTLSKGLTGTMLMAIIGAAVDKGLITGGADKDKDVAQFEKEIMGIMPYSIKIGDTNYAYDWALPLGGTAAAVADGMAAYEQAEENKQSGKIANATLEAVKAAGKSLFNQSFVTGISEMFADGDPVSGVINVLLGEPSKFTPTLASQVAQWIDKTSRTSYVYGNPTKTAINRVIAKTPFARGSLPTAMNTLGQPKQFNGSFVDVFLNPANYTSENNSPSAEWLYSLYKDTGEKSVLPPAAPYYIDYKEQRIILTPQQKEDYQVVTGSIIDNGTQALINSPYADITGEEALDFTEGLQDYAREKAKALYVPDYTVSQKTKDIDSLIAEGIPDAEVIVLYNRLNGVKKSEAEEQGYSNAAELKRKIIMDTDYTAEQKTALAQAFISDSDDTDFSSAEAFKESTSTAKSRGWESVQNNKAFSGMTQPQYNEAYKIVTKSEKGYKKEDKLKDLANYFSITYGYTSGTARRKAESFWKEIY